jgi:2'-hydroxyisoflavone reductase
MPLSRRDFLATSAATAAAYALAARSLASYRRDDPAKPGAGPTDTQLPKPPPNLTLSDEEDDNNIKPADKKIRILILGGTAFTGPHLVRLALARGHDVTVFNRGLTERKIGSLPDSVHKLIGDRDPHKGQGLNALDSMPPHNNMDTWDAIVDTSGYYPRHVRATGMLANRTKTYIYISSISAYQNPIPPNADESAPLATLEDPKVEDMGKNFENYGGLKVLCEKEVHKFMHGKCAIVRPTFISGPGDPTDRFTYWPVRISKGGEVLCPGTPEDPVQFIDVRDLAAFLLTLCETQTYGTFNACGPSAPAGAPASHAHYTIGDLVNDCKHVSRSDAKLTWVDADFLGKTDPEFNVPIWVPPQSEEAGMGTMKFDAALKAGMKLRPPADTIKATLAWWPREVARRERIAKELTEQAKKEGKEPPKFPPADVLRSAPRPGQEQALLTAWHNRKTP